MAEHNSEFTYVTYSVKVQTQLHRLHERYRKRKQTF